MAQKGVKGVRAAFADAREVIASLAEAHDPPPEEARGDVPAGGWPGYPFDALPPDCPVTPIGKDGTVSYFIDSLDQLRGVASKDWNGNAIVDLFAMRPHFVSWAWPKWSEGKKGKSPIILGFDVRDVTTCLVKQAAKRGLFDPSERVRGRGAWVAREQLIWHSGDLLWAVSGRKLESSRPGEIDGMFYPRRPPIMRPWPEPVDPDDTPAHAIYKALCTWTLERGPLDAVLIVGAIGCMLLSGALPHRPHLAFMGDFGVGKSALQTLVQSVLASALHRAGNASEAGIRQRLGLDAMPVALDEFEAKADNMRAKAILDLARISYDGQRLWRGGQDHKGVEFQARSSFLCSGIQLPPMNSADRSRFAVLNLGKIDAKRMGDPPVINQASGRMLLRALMDAWPRFPAVHDDWRRTLRQAGLSDRAQNTYGILLAVAQLLLGEAALEDAGLPVTEAERLGLLVAAATAEERASQTPNWRDCLERLLGSPIDVRDGGTKPTVGALLEAVEKNKDELPLVQQKLAAGGLAAIIESDPLAAFGKHRVLLAVPCKSPLVEKLFAGSIWQEGGWTSALRQGVEADVVAKDGRNVKINRASTWCRIVDLAAYDRLAGGG